MSFLTWKNGEYTINFAELLQCEVKYYFQDIKLVLDAWQVLSQC